MGELTEYVEGVLKTWVESRAGMVHPGLGNSSRNKNGTPYIVFACGGPVEECQSAPLLARDFEALEKYFKQGVEEYLFSLKIEGPKVLYWRASPVVKKIKLEDSESFFYTVRARFVVDAV